MLRHALTRRLTIASALLIATGLPSGSWAAAMSDAETPKTAFERFIAAFNALDWGSFRACFADDASVFNPEIPEVVSLHRLDGRATIEDTFRTVFDASARGSAGSPQIVPENLRIQQFNGIAIVTFEFRRSNASFGRRTVVLHHQGHAWLVVHIHASNVNTHP
jgi:hypothetical protein